MLRSAIARVIARQDLDRDQAREAIRTIMNGEATPAQIAGLLVGLRMKGETVDEIVGAAEAMRAAAARIDVDVDGVVDTCGTGGDGAGTFNISTAAAFVAAGAGVRVAKHGNRAVSSGCGSADVLEALGVTLHADPGLLTSCLDEAGMVFLFAPFQHPAMKHAVGPRKELGVRTLFNVLGPLTNPAGARRQLMGVYDPGLVETLAVVLGELGAERAMVVHGAGGLDELSTLGPSRFAEWDGATVRSGVLDPADVGIDVAATGDLAGGTAGHNAAIVRGVLEGRPGPPRDIVLLNAGAAIHVAGRATDIAAGVEMARRAVDEGAALARLEALIAATAPHPEAEGDAAGDGAGAGSGEDALGPAGGAEASAAAPGTPGSGADTPAAAPGGEAGAQAPAEAGGDGTGDGGRR